MRFNFPHYPTADEFVSAALPGVSAPDRALFVGPIMARDAQHART